MKVLGNIISAVLGAGLLCLGLALYWHSQDFAAAAFMLLVFGGIVRVAVVIEEKE